MFEKSSSKTKQEQVYEIIKNYILTGVLAENELLVERKLSESLGVSRTPLRAALNELCADNLIVNYPGIGMMVASMTMEDIIEIYQIRLILDEIAFRMFLEGNNTKIIDEMQKCVERMKKYIDTKKFLQCVEQDMAFHSCYYLNISNQRLRRILSSLGDQSKRIQHFTADNQMCMIRTYEEHKSIMDAVDKQDIDEACRRLTYHLQQEFGYYLEKMKKGRRIVNNAYGNY